MIEQQLHYLKLFGPEKVKNSYALFEGGDENDSLQNQTRLWMSVIAPGVLTFGRKDFLTNGIMC